MYLHSLALILVLAVTPISNASSFFDSFYKGSLTDGSRYAFIPSASENKIIAIDTLNNQVSESITLQHIAGSIVISEKQDVLLATDPDNESVSVINLETKEVIKQWDLGMRPDSVLIYPFDNYVAFGSSNGSVSVWDIKNHTQMLRIDGLDSADKMTFGINGRFLYIVEERLKRIAVIEMYKRKVVNTIALGGKPDEKAAVSALSRSPDGSTGFVSITSENRLVAIDLVNLKVNRSVPLGKAPIRPYITSDNRFILVPLRDEKAITLLSTATQNVVMTIPSNIKARTVHTGWLDTVAMILPEESNNIAVVNLRRLALESMIVLPGAMDDGIVTSDSKKLFTAIPRTGEVASIDLRARKLSSILKIPLEAPGGIAMGVSNNICH